MIEIKDPVTIQDLDAFLGIAAFVDSKLPPVRPPKAKQMYDLLEVLPSPDDFKYYEKDNFVRIIPTARQLTIYGFILSVMPLADYEDRLLIFKRNFPRRKSFRQIKKEGWLHWSHQTIAYKYKRALFTLCQSINKQGIKKFI
tara:strand:+ start:1228 stop:1653 length:426 start_codon:yes stop_codon:yes gene_type:complete